MSADFRRVFGRIAPILRTELPADLRSFAWSATSWQAKAWFGNRALHYELWVRPSAKVLELGLHFEADALTNARLLGAFRSRAKEITRGLGDGARIEEWDKGWARIWEAFPLQKIDPGYTARVRGRFVAYVRVLEPILREELPNDVEWVLTASRGSRSGRPRRS